MMEQDLEFRDMYNYLRYDKLTNDAEKDLVAPILQYFDPISYGKKLRNLRFKA